MFVDFPIAVARARADLAREKAEDDRLRALPPEQQVFELRLREVKALEKLASQKPTIKVKNTLF